MDNNRQQYLLHYRYQIDSYREHYAAFIKKYGEKYRQWFQSLPMCEWVPLPYMDEKTAKAVIGLLCILYIDGKINLTVNSDVTKVYRDALNDEEYQNYLKQRTKSIKK